MVTMKRAVAVGGVVFGLLLAAAGAQAGWGNRSMLTFSGAVALPNGTIGAGTYTFEVVNPESGGNIVSVRTKDRVCYLGFTNRIERPRGMRDDQLVSLGESRIGVAPPVLAWYPASYTRGFEFIYRD